MLIAVNWLKKIVRYKRFLLLDNQKNVTVNISKSFVLLPLRWLHTLANDIYDVAHASVIF